MGGWSSDSKSNVAHMADDDFYSSEKSAVVVAFEEDGTCRLHYEDPQGGAVRLSAPIVSISCGVKKASDLGFSSSWDNCGQASER